MLLKETFKKLIPNLTNDSLHKGQCGKIGILGGSKEYTGAPYFAAISSLKVGADLSYVFTTNDASLPIKSYSPELIVLPLLDDSNNESEMKSWLSRLDTLIIGPGLGRSENAENSFNLALKTVKTFKIPIVIDADGLYFVSKNNSLINGYEKCILSPNIIEFKRLYDAYINDGCFDELKENNKPTLEEQCKAVEKLALAFNNVTIIKKGKCDIISDGRYTVYNDSQASLKRCGGVGDLLSGSLGTFACWCNKQNIDKPNIIAAYNASILIRGLIFNFFFGLFLNLVNLI